MICTVHRYARPLQLPYDRTFWVKVRGGIAPCEYIAGKFDCNAVFTLSKSSLKCLSYFITGGHNNVANHSAN